MHSLRLTAYFAPIHANKTHIIHASDQITFYSWEITDYVRNCLGVQLQIEPVVNLFSEVEVEDIDLHI